MRRPGEPERTAMRQAADQISTTVSRAWPHWDAASRGGVSLRDSDGQALGLDVPVEDLGAGLGGKCGFDFGAAAVLAVEGDAAAAAGAADFWGDGTIGESGLDEVIHLRRCDVGRETFASRMRFGQDLAESGPVFFLQSGTSIFRCVADAFEDVEYFRVAVDVSFCDLPIVRSGISRLAGVAYDDAAF